VEKLDKMAEVAGYEYERTEKEKREKAERQVISSHFSTMATLAYRVGAENGLNPFTLLDCFLYHSSNTVTLKVGSTSHGVTIHLAITEREVETVLEYYVYDGSYYGHQVDSLGLAVYLTQKKEQ